MSGGDMELVVKLKLTCLESTAIKGEELKDEVISQLESLFVEGWEIEPSIVERGEVKEKVAELKRIIGAIRELIPKNWEENSPFNPQITVGDNISHLFNYAEKIK